jgi:hypothetical protein
MSTLTQFLSPLKSATQIPAYERGALTPSVTTTSVTSSTPSDWTTVLTISSPGILYFALARQTDAVSKTVGIRVLIDGAQVAAVTRAVASTTANNGVVAGAPTDPISAAGIFAPGFNPFRTLQIQIRSSVASDNIAWLAEYTLT